MALASLINTKNHMKHTLALVLAGGRGSRLHGLTEHRAKPAVTFGGKYRLIDFALSNCLNSGVGQVGVLTQYGSESVEQHLNQTWSMRTDEGTPYVKTLPSDPRNGYKGTADAIKKNLQFINASNADYVLVLAGDHIYSMDYTALIAHHVSTGADMTISAIPTSLEQGRGFGVLTVNSKGRIEQFVEKPNEPQPMPGSKDQCLSSMGIYVFNTQFLRDTLFCEASELEGDDFGCDIIPTLINTHRVMAYSFDQNAPHGNYWKDVGTLDSYWQANLDLIGEAPNLNMHNAQWPTKSEPISAPPAKFIFDSAEVCGAAVNSSISEGCVISGALIKNSVISTNVTANEQSHIVDSVILPNCTIGKNCRLRGVVVDEGCSIPDGTVIGYDAVEDARRFQISETDVVLVTQTLLDVIEHPPLRKAA